MKKCLQALPALFSLILLYSCADLYDPTRDALSPWGSTSTFGIYSEDVPVSVVWDHDAVMDIWQDSGGNMLVQDQGTYVAEGTQAWKFTGTGSWMGMGIRVNPLTNYRDLGAFDGGRLHFWYKGTKGFKVGVKSGTSQEAWIAAGLMVSYGLQTNNAWCEINIPVSALIYANPYIDLNHISQYFMWVANASFGYSVGDVYYIDGIYWSKDYNGPAADKYTPTNFGLYSDTVENSVLWDNNCKLDIWSDYDAGMLLTNIETGAFEGLNCWQMTGTGSWMGMGIRVNPTTNYSDMSDYLHGALHFSIKGTNTVNVGIKSGTANNVWMTASQLSNYGYLPDGNWHEVIIPFIDFSGIDYTHISQYFMLQCNVSLGYQTNIVIYLDHIYWSLTN